MGIQASVFSPHLRTLRVLDGAPGPGLGPFPRFPALARCARFAAAGSPPRPAP
jgi:hypothetical protein